jgi:hypothetical protein
MENFPLKAGWLMIPVIFNTAMFIGLSMLHFYWAFGGRLWRDAVLPVSSDGLRKFDPGVTSTIFVAIALLLLAGIIVANDGFFDQYIKRQYFRYCTLIIACAFLLRAIGDFKFVGFFKTIKFTRFAVNDTQLFSPLCLLIALSCILIFVFTGNRFTLGRH